MTESHRMFKHKHLIIRLIAGICSLWSLSHAAAQNCGCTNCPQLIPDESVTELFVQVSNASNPTLGQNGQGVCGVELFFEHEYLGDLEITLTAPSGKKVTLVAPIDFFPDPSGGGNTDGTVWKVLFTPCGQIADPDPGFTAKWDNQQPWGVFGNYTGTYYPHQGCLEGLTGPVNGVWKLTINDGNFEDEGFFRDYRIIFCDPTGLQCYSCEANAGNLVQPDFAACEGDSTLKLKLPPTYTPTNPEPKSPGYQYAYVVSGKGGVILRYDSLPDLRKDAAGTYSLCGLSFIGEQKSQLPKPNGTLTVQQLATLLNSPTAPICGDVSTNCVNVTIHPIPSDVLDTVLVCAPDCYVFGGKTLCKSGFYQDTLKQNGCRYLSKLWLTILPPDTTKVAEVICKGECAATPGFSTACTSGIFTQNTKNRFGCDSLVILDLKVLDTKAVIAKPDSLSCAVKKITLDATASSNGAGVTYFWSSSAGGVLSGPVDGPTAVATAAGDFKVKICQKDAKGILCCDSASVSVGFSKNAPPLPPMIQGVAQTCKGDSVVYSISPVKGAAAYGWSAPAGAKIELLPGDTSISVVWTQAVKGDICVSVVDSCGQKSSNLCLAIQALEVLSAPVPSGVLKVCEGKTSTYTIAPVAGASSYLWSVNAPHKITAGQGSISANILWGNDPVGKICVAVQNECGNGADTCVDVAVDLLPQKPVILGPKSSCFGDTVEYQLVALPGSSFAWKVTGGTVIGNSNDLRIKVLWNNGLNSVCATLSNNCGDGPSTCQQVDVAPAPVIGTLERQCDTATNTLFITFPIIGGKAPFAGVGGSVTNNVFTSDPLPDGGKFKFKVIDINGCESGEVSGTAKCPCKTWAGNMKTEKLVVCEGGEFTVPVPAGTRLDTNDVGLFVIHTRADNMLGTVLAESKDGFFTKTAGIDFDLVYYISYIIGDSKNGSPDPSDFCFQVAPGQPVVFVRNPVSDAGPDLSTCGQALDLAAVGTGKWSVEYEATPGSLLVFNPLNKNSKISAQNSGLYRMAWTVTDANGCLGKDEVVLRFNPTPKLANLSRVCDASNSNYTVNLTLTGGVQPYEVNGQKITGNTFVSSSYLNNSAYTFEVKDSNGCTMPIIKGAFDCKCTTNAGTMGSQILQICEGGTATAQANNDQNLDANDIVAYVLHDGNGQSIGNILALNATGKFGFQAGMNYGTTYYISRVAGNNLNGIPNFNDLCFSVAKGQPVVFYENPKSYAGKDTLICGQDAVLNALPSAYLGKWSPVSGPGLALFTDDKNPRSTVAVSVVGAYRFKWEENNVACATSDTVSVVFSEVPRIEDLVKFCNSTNTGYTLKFDIKLGNNPFMVNGLNGALNNDVFTSVEQPDGTGYSVYVTDANGCKSAVNFGTHFCECTTNAGLMQTGTQSIFCSNEPAIAVHKNDQKLDANDILEFVLHDGSGSSIGTILARNSQAVFPFTANLATGKTYYISAVAGNRLPAGGGVDFSDVCLSTTPGVPILWKKSPAVTLTGADTICAGTEAVLSFAGDGTFPLTVAWTDGFDLKETVLTGNQIVTLGVSPAITTVYYLIAVYDGTQPVCATPLTDIATITVMPRPQAGEQAEPFLLCENADEVIELNQLLRNADMGGSWAEITPISSKPGAFDALNGQFKTKGVAYGQYTFSYIVQSVDNCPKDTAVVKVDLVQTPLADAGENQTLNCDQATVVLGSDIVVGGATYRWVFGTDTVGKTSQVLADSAGRYVMYVTVPPGCMGTDTVEVSLDNRPPEATFITKDLRCFGDQNGSIELDSLIFGRQPVLYALNGGPFSNQTKFGGLAAGVYRVTLQDANGCEWTSEKLGIAQPPQLSAKILPSDSLVRLGDTLALRLLSSYATAALSQITWKPLLDSQHINSPMQKFAPAQTQGITVEIADTNGCKAKASARVRVDRARHIYVPNIIMPQSSENGIALIYGGSDVEQVNAFEIFDRWGSLVFAQRNFQPNDPSKGWNAQIGGEKVTPAVFTWRAEVRFKDGLIETFFGTTTVIK